MMKRNEFTFAIVVGALALLILDPSGLSQSSPVENLPAPPSREEILLVEELAAWVAGSPVSGGFEIVDEGMADAIRTRRRSFELFRSFADDDSRQRLLASKPYGELIDQAAQETGIDGLLLAAVVQAESSFDPGVISSRGALGLMQLMPETAAQYGTREPLDPGHNLRAGSRYLHHLIGRYQGDLELALAAYNAGPGNVRRYGGVPPFRETSRYVDKVLGTYVDYHRRLWATADVAELLNQVESSSNS